MALESPGPMRLAPDEMRTLGYRAVDTIVERFAGLAEQPVLRRWTRDDLRQRLSEPIPRTGQPPLAVLSRAVDQVLSTCAAIDHPRFMSYVPAPSNYVGVVADFLASGYNVFAGSWLAGAGAAEVEMAVLDWMRAQLGLPDGAGGILTNGGTQATLICVHAARMRLAAEHRPTCRVYVSDQTHASILRGLVYLGFAPEQVECLPTGPDMTLDPATARARIADDRAAGRHPLCLIATAGTTNTGAVDPLAELADVCAELDVWLHVDAAFGAAAVLTEPGRALLDGIGRADSIAVDPHKWFFQPFEIGCALVRHEASLPRAFSLHAEYLTETLTNDYMVNFYDRGPQLTRGFRALKLWMSLQVFGTDAMAEGVAHGLAMAELAETLLRQRPGWQVVTPAQLAIVTFRPMLAHLTDEQIDTLTLQVAEDTIDDGYALVLTTQVDGRPVLRLCTINPSTTPDDLAGTLDMLDRLVRHRSSAITTAGPTGAGGRPVADDRSATGNAAAVPSDANAVYSLGRSPGESTRLRQQADELAPDSRILLDRVGLRPGQSALDLGCGPHGILDLLAERVMPGGRVVGVDADPTHVVMARDMASAAGLTDVEVIVADARRTGLPAGSFDLVHVRTLLANIPRPAEVVAEMTRLARPGGWVAAMEPDVALTLYYPSHPSIERLTEISRVASARDGADPRIGRRLAELFHEAGLVDVEVEARAAIYPHGHTRRTLRVDLVRAMRPQILELGLASAGELDELDAAARAYLDDPRVVVMPALFLLASGRRPA